jgi:hypothetical protein
VVTEDDVERRIGQRHVLGAAVDERELDPGRLHQPAGVLELPVGQVDADRPRAELRERDRPLRRAASQLQDVLADDVAEDLQLRLGDLVGTPRETGARRELLAVASLVVVAVGVPRCAVLRLVRREVG